MIPWSLQQEKGSLQWAPPIKCFHMEVTQVSSTHSLLAGESHWPTLTSKGQEIAILTRPPQEENQNIFE